MGEVKIENMRNILVSARYMTHVTKVQQENIFLKEKIKKLEANRVSFLKLILRYLKYKYIILIYSKLIIHHQ